jgi:hypothetical protein
MRQQSDPPMKDTWPVRLHSICVLVSFQHGFHVRRSDQGVSQDLTDVSRSLQSRGSRRLHYQPFDDPAACRSLTFAPHSSIMTHSCTFCTRFPAVPCLLPLSHLLYAHISLTGRAYGSVVGTRGRNRRTAYAARSVQ